MLVIPRAQLQINTRQRKEIPRASLLELKASILESCLLHAPVVQQNRPHQLRASRGGAPRPRHRFDQRRYSDVYLRQSPNSPQSHPCGSAL